MNEHEPRNRAERRAAGRKRGIAGAMTATKIGALAAATTAAAFAGSGATPASGATTFTVTTLNDTGAGSLREAVADANSTAGADIINFQAGLTGTITLTTGQLDIITEAVDIQGPGASVITVEGTGTDRIFYIDASSATFDVTISGLTLTHDATTVTGDGGAILNNTSHLTVRNAVIDGIDVDSEGGGIESFGDTNSLTVDTSTLSDNTADSDGGAIQVTDERAELNVINSTVTGNDAGSDGGGLYFYSNTGIVNITGSTLSNNTADGEGGAAWLGGSHSRGTLTNSTVSGNESGNDGGGIAFYTEGVLIENSTISNNTADGRGGALYLDNNEFGVEIHNSVISGNHATDGGGGGIDFYYTTGPVNIVDTTVSGNTTSIGGGGLYFDSAEEQSPAPVTIRNSTISGNTADGWGGGLYISEMLNTFKIMNSTISGNTAGEEGGGINFNGYYGLVLIQDTITNNTATNYGGLYLPNSKAAVDAKAAGKANAKANNSRNEHVTASKAANQQGAQAQLTSRYEYDGETTSIATIIAGNSGTDLGPGSTVHSDHSLFGTVAAGVTIDDKGGTLIGANPVLGPLANNGGPTETHALLTGSAAIDTGLTVEPAFPGNEFDQRGAPYDRVENGVSDIGAYEVQLVVPPPAPTPAPDVVIITPRFTG